MKNLLYPIIIFLFHIFFYAPLLAYTGWPGGSITKDLGKEALKLQKEENYEGAIALHEHILELEPCNVWSHEKLGDIYESLRKYPESVLHFREAQETVKCNKTEHVQLEDYARIAKKIKNVHELKQADEKKQQKTQPRKEPSLFRKGDKVMFETVSILFKHKYQVEGEIEVPGSSKSKVRITDDGGSIYLEDNVYTIENHIMKRKK